MALSYVGGGSDGQNATSIAPTYPSGVQSGDVVYLLWTYQTTATGVTNPSGYIQRASVAMTSGGGTVRLLTRVCDGSETAGSPITCSASLNKMTASLSVIRGVDTAAVLDGSLQSRMETSAGTTHASPSVTPSVSGCAIGVAIAERSSSGTSSYTAPSGYTKRAEGATTLGGMTITAEGDDGLSTPHAAGVAVTPGVWTSDNSFSTQQVLTFTWAVPPAAQNITGSATASGVSTATATGRATQLAAGTASASSSASSSGSVIQRASAPGTSVSAASASGRVTQRSQTSAVASSSATADGVVRQQALASGVSQAVASASAIVHQAASAAGSSISTAAASGVVTSPSGTVLGSATGTTSSTATATAELTSYASAVCGSASSGTASGRVTVYAAAIGTAVSSGSATVSSGTTRGHASGRDRPVVTASRHAAPAPAITASPVAAQHMTGRDRSLSRMGERP